MKSSYKLYGAFWDQRKISAGCPLVLSSEETEMPMQAAILKLSDVMKKEERKEISERENIYLDIDFIPANKSAVVWRFYVKRLVQIAEYYRAELFSQNPKIKMEVNAALRDFYEKKGTGEIVGATHRCSSDDM